jgi:hypothetical protein
VGTTVRQESAKIYQFPRTIAANSVGLCEKHAIAPDFRLQPMPAVEMGSGWYHEAAIEAERTRKR